MISIRELYKTYRGARSGAAVHAVRGVTLELETGQVVGLLGPNGAGKSTTIRMITGFLPPDAGRIQVGGIDVVENPLKARAGIGYLPENAPLYPEMTPRSYLGYRASLFGLRGKARKEAIGRVIERCRLRTMANRRIGALSKGYRQRVGLAAALIHDPPVLVLDEPANGLDPSQILETRSLVRELAEDRTMLISSHILAEIERTCDRVIIMAGGMVRADGTPDDLANSHGSGHALQVETGEGDPGWLTAIEGVSGVESHALGDGWVQHLVSTAGDGAGLAEHIAVAAVGAGRPIRELSRHRPTLEEVFMRVTEQEHVAEKIGGQAE